MFGGVRERERERQRDRETERDRDRQTETKTETDRLVDLQTRYIWAETEPNKQTNKSKTNN